MTQPTSSSHHHTHDHDHDHNHAHGHAAETSQRIAQVRSVLAWPAWLRVVAVLPVVLALWLAVWWANTGVSPW